MTPETSRDREDSESMDVRKTIQFTASKPNNILPSLISRMYNPNKDSQIPASDRDDTGPFFSLNAFVSTFHGLIGLNTDRL